MRISDGFEGGDLLRDFKREGAQVGVEEPALTRGQLFEQLIERRGVAGGEGGSGRGAAGGNL